MLRFSRVGKSIVAVAVGLTALVVTSSPAHGAAGFGDVEENRFYTKPIQWMVDTGITTGTAPGCFSPDRQVTRAEIAAFLHRYAGQPEAGAEPFLDVKSGDWYRDAVAWMAASGITTGTSATTFSPELAVTRAQLAAFLHRFAGSPNEPANYAVAPPLEDVPFEDIPGDAYFARSVEWMVDEGITTGTSPTTFSPYRAVTRGELAAFLHRFAGSPWVAVESGGQCGAPTVVDDDLAIAEAHSLSLLNQLRISVGVAPLARAEIMDDFARDWSRTMSEGDFFAHSGGPYGENIVWWSNENISPTEAAQKFHEMWVNSSGHYQNMTLAGYTKVGIGLWRDENGWHGTHVFSW